MEGERQVNEKRTTLRERAKRPDRSPNDLGEELVPQRFQEQPGPTACHHQRSSLGGRHLAPQGGDGLQGLDDVGEAEWMRGRRRRDTGGLACASHGSGTSFGGSERRRRSLIELRVADVADRAGDRSRRAALGAVALEGDHDILTEGWVARAATHPSRTSAAAALVAMGTSCTSHTLRSVCGSGSNGWAVCGSRRNTTASTSRSTTIPAI